MNSIWKEISYYFDDVLSRPKLKHQARLEPVPPSSQGRMLFAITPSAPFDLF